MSDFKNVIITGGAGFVGSHLVNYLAARSENVVVIDKQDADPVRKNDQAQYYRLNIQNNGIFEIFEKFKPDVVFHLAAHLNDRESVEKPIDNAFDNVIGFLKVCEANRKFGGGKMVFMSSCAVYGNQTQLPITENAVPNPQTPYGITKFTGEKYLNFYMNKYGIPFVAFRAGNIYGPAQDSSAESGVIGIFSAKILKNEPVVINNDGQTTRDYIYVGDVVEALIQGALSEKSGIYNLGTGLQTKTEEILQLVKNAAGIEPKVSYDEKQLDAVKHICLDSSLAEQELAWRPTVDLKTGVQQTVDWYKENI